MQYPYAYVVFGAEVLRLRTLDLAPDWHGAQTAEVSDSACVLCRAQAGRGLGQSPSQGFHLCLEVRGLLSVGPYVEEVYPYCCNYLLGYFLEPRRATHEPLVASRFNPRPCGSCASVSQELTLDKILRIWVHAKHGEGLPRADLEGYQYYRVMLNTQL